MMRKSFFGIFAWATICTAWRSGGARLTRGYSLVATDVSPVPTQVPLLEKRAGEQPLTVCGFIGGSNALPATCSASSACAWNTDYSIVGCCHTSKANGCLFFTGCEDIKSTHISDDPMIYTCRGTSTCFQNTYDGGFKQWGCGFSPTTVLLTYSGQSPDAPTVVQSFMGTKDMVGIAGVTTVTAPGSTTASATSPSTSAASSANTTPASGTTSNSSSTPSNTPAATQGAIVSASPSSTSSSSTSSAPASPSDTAAPAKTGTSTGTIIGSALGSVAFGAIVAGLIAWFLIRRKKRNAKIAKPISQEPMSIIGSGSHMPKDPYHNEGNSNAVSTTQFSSNPSQYGTYAQQSPTPQYGWPPGSNTTSQNGLHTQYQAYNPPQDMPPTEMDASQGAGYQNVPQRGPNTMAEAPGHVPDHYRYKS